MQTSKPFRAVGTALLLSCSASTAAMDYPQLLGILGHAHPEYQAMQDETEAARAALARARALPDPVVKMELMEIDDLEMRPDRVGETKYTVEQMFPLWGKRTLRQDAARAAVEASAARSELTLAELRAMLRASYAELYEAHAAAAINRELQALVDDMASAARERYANGIGAQGDVIRAATEGTRLAVEREAIDGRGARARASIAGLLGDPAALPTTPPAALPDTSGFEAAWARVRDPQGAASPVIDAATREVAQRRAERELAARERYPDLTVGVTPVQTGTRFDTWELMLSIKLPLYGGTRAMERESVSMLAASEDRLRAAERRIRAAAGEVAADFAAARAGQQLIEGRLLPEAELNLRAALAGYRSGEADFDTLIEAGRQLGEVRLQGLEAAVRQQLAMARFEQITGVQP
jgi:outer membrane protein TolC